jgi:hypothetical protein
LALVALTVHVPSERWALPAGVVVPEGVQGGGAVTWFVVQLQVIRDGAFATMDLTVKGNKEKRLRKGKGEGQQV